MARIKEEIMNKGHHNTHTHHHAHHKEDFKKRFIISSILTLPVLFLSGAVQSLLGYSTNIPYQLYILIILSTVIYAYGGYPFLKGMVGEIKKRQPGMMTLIGTAITVAFFYSVYASLFTNGKDFFWELATLIDVMLLGHWIEMRSVLGASRALEELVKIMPSEAYLVKPSGQIVDIPVKNLKVNDIVLVKPGEKIPSDGTVAEGNSAVNESLLTGESKPVDKKPGSRVIGGSINESGVLKIKIERVGDETYLSQVIKIVKLAQESRSKTQDLANRAAALLFYVAMVAGIITFGVWLPIKNPSFALERAVTVLVIACPHALGLAIPLVVAISTAITAKSGILIRNRRAFEMVRKINAIVFDKTGTLTEGKFGVSEILTTMDEKEFLSIVFSIERNSEHVIAKSISEYAQKQGANALQVKNFRGISGKGVYAEVENKKVYLGGPNLLKDLKIKPSGKFEEFHRRGGTVVSVIVNGNLVGAIRLEDRIRESSREAVKTLKLMGIRVFMLTGDNREVARWVAEELGIDEYFAEVLPHEKSEKINELKSRGYTVAMVGDGINDAPALVSADVGIAIGAGTDVAIESADIILVKNDPLAIPDLINISRKTYSKMLQNLWWAAGYNIVTIPLAAGVLYWAGVLVNPAIGAALMSLSTVIVAINSQTLRRKS